MAVTTVMTVLGPQWVIGVLLAPFTVLAAGMSGLSGFLAAWAMRSGASPEEVGVAVDRGVGTGFVLASPLALYAFGAALFSAHG